MFLQNEIISKSFAISTNLLDWPVMRKRQITHTHNHTQWHRQKEEGTHTLSFSLAFPISPSIQTSLSGLQLWEGNYVFIARRGSTAEQLVVRHGRRLYLTCCDVNTWLVRFHGFSSETGRALSYQCGAETDEAAKERETETHGQIRGQIDRQPDWKGRSEEEKIKIGVWGFKKGNTNNGST